MIHSYSQALIEILIKSFGPDHVISIRAIEKKLQKLTGDYYNQVYVQGIIVCLFLNLVVLL